MRSAAVWPKREAEVAIRKARTATPTIDTFFIFPSYPGSRPWRLYNTKPNRGQARWSLGKMGVGFAIQGLERLLDALPLRLELRFIQGGGDSHGFPVDTH